MGFKRLACLVSFLQARLQGEQLMHRTLRQRHHMFHFASIALYCLVFCLQARLQGEQLMHRTLRQRSDRLDRQAAAQAQQQQQQHDDTTQQGRDQSTPSSGAAKSGTDADAAGDEPAFAFGATHQSRTYKKAKRQQHRQSRQQQQQQAGGKHAQERPANPAEEEAAAAAAEACERDGLLCALDLLKSAALLARERDLQAEAQAVSRMGHLYKVRHIHYQT
jgi:hypothetical protein